MNYQEFFDLVEKTQMKKPCGEGFTTEFELEKWDIPFHIIDNEANDEEEIFVPGTNSKEVDKGFYIFELDDGFALAKRKLFNTRHMTISKYGFERYKNLRKLESNDETIKKLYKRKIEEIKLLEKIMK